MANEQLLTIIASLGGLILTSTIAIVGLILAQSRVVRSKLRDIRNRMDDQIGNLRDRMESQNSDLRDRLGRIEAILTCFGSSLSGAGAAQRRDRPSSMVTVDAYHSTARYSLCSRPELPPASDHSGVLDRLEASNLGNPSGPGPTRGPVGRAGEQDGADRGRSVLWTLSDVDHGAPEANSGPGTDRPERSTGQEGFVMDGFTRERILPVPCGYSGRSSQIRIIYFIVI